MGHKIYLRNELTGEEQVHIDRANFAAPWRIVKVEKYNAPDSKQGRLDAKLAVWATKVGLPVAEFSDAARWLLDKDCPFCQMGSKILKRIDELGPDTTEWALGQILEAKAANNHARLQQIRETLCLDKPTSLT